MGEREIEQFIDQLVGNALGGAFLGNPGTAEDLGKFIHVAA